MRLIAFFKNFFNGAILCGYSPLIARLWVLLFIAALCSVADIMAYYLSPQLELLRVAGIICVAVLKATLLTWIFGVSCRLRWLHILVTVCIIGFVFLSLVNGLSWIFYGFGISRKLLNIVAETNVKELLEFLPELGAKFSALILSFQFWSFICVMIILWFLVPHIPGKGYIWVTGVLSLVGIGYLGYVMATANWGKSNYIVYVRTASCCKAIMRNRRMVREIKSVKRALPDATTLSSGQLAKRVVVVIGESASRDHLSVYGYHFPTTPWLDTLSRGKYVFNDALGSSTSTAENIPRLLTFMTDEPSDHEWYEYPTLLQVFSLAGYRTYWFSNQERTGEYSNLSGILSEDADVVEYLGCQDSEDHLTYRYDEVLLPAFKKTLSAPDSLQLTFLHLMGSHFQYDNRVPHDRHHFTAEDIMKSTPRKWLNRSKAQVVANYDNSILYTDSVLGVVIRSVENRPEPTVVVYLSDHGENVYDDRDFRGRDPKFVKVPFIIFANDAYRSANPSVMAEIEEAVDRPFSTSELPQILMHLTGTRYCQYDSLRDPLSSSFRQRTRYIDGDPAASGGHPGNGTSK